MARGNFYAASGCFIRYTVLLQIKIQIFLKLGISNATFNAIMNGKRTTHADDLKAICLARNVRPNCLLIWHPIKENKQYSVYLFCPIRHCIINDTMPLELVDCTYEPELIPLTISPDESVKSSDCCEVCQRDRKLFFRAGEQEQYVDKLPEN